MPVGRIDGNNNLLGDRCGADEKEMDVGIGATGPLSAVNHDGGSIIPAEEVDGDPWRPRLP